jgi:FtsH-binding integral membrane protein
MAAGQYAAPLPQAQAQGLFGRVMGLVALTVGFATLGVYLFRNAGGALWFIAWILAFGCLIGLNAASSRGNNGLALGLLFAFGLLIGASVSSTINYYSATDPTAVRQAFGATALFIGGLGATGYAIRRDLSFLYRFLFWALLALIVAGFVLIFVHMPGAYTAYAVIGLVIFAGYTVVDFNRLRRAGQQEAIPLAASIFLDVLNVFLLFLRLFAGEGR